MIRAFDQPSRTETASARREPLRVAIIGCGPQGMYALESLVRRLKSRSQGSKLEAFIFNSSHSIGTGDAYIPNQPPFLRMNYASKHIDAWERGTFEPEEDKPTLVVWLKAHYPNLSNPNDFIPRYIIGEYLQYCFRQILKESEGVMEIHIQNTPVSEIIRKEAQWEIESAGMTWLVDEVLINAGHPHWQKVCPASQSNFRRRAKREELVFPAQSQRSLEVIKPGTTVAMRGFSLPWIDAVLALTEGRGGHFYKEDGELEYRRSGNEPSRIIPLSRSGKPMLSKPDENVVQPSYRLEELWNQARLDILNQTPSTQGIRFIHSLWPQVLNAADEALPRPERGAAISWFNKWSTSNFSKQTIPTLMKESLDVARGIIPPTVAWALGEAWRQLYPAMEQQIRSFGLADCSWHSFSLITREMERIAFGPPPSNMERIVALIKDGLIDLSFLPRGNRKQFFPRSETIDFKINATPPPPSDWVRSGPLISLSNAGILSKHPRSGGIRIDKNACAISSEGQSIESLTVISRLTEGCIVGADTLSRRTNKLPERWAEKVVSRTSKAVHRAAFSEFAMP